MADDLEDGEVEEVPGAHAYVQLSSSHMVMNGTSGETKQHNESKEAHE